jgi:hypothetical protein
MQAREAGKDRHSVEREGGIERVQIFFWKHLVKHQKPPPPPAIDHHGRTALIMPLARFTTARRALNLRRFE